MEINQLLHHSKRYHYDEHFKIFILLMKTHAENEKRNNQHCVLSGRLKKGVKLIFFFFKMITANCGLSNPFQSSSIVHSLLDSLYSHFIYLNCCKQNLLTLIARSHGGYEN